MKSLQSLLILSNSKLAPKGIVDSRGVYYVNDEDKVDPKSRKMLVLLLFTCLTANFLES